MEGRAKAAPACEQPLAKRSEANADGTTPVNIATSSPVAYAHGAHIREDRHDNRSASRRVGEAWHREYHRDGWDCQCRRDQSDRLARDAGAVHTPDTQLREGDRTQGDHDLG